MSHEAETETDAVHGVIAEFEHEADILAAAEAAYAAGYRKMDAYSPHPVDGLAEAMGFTKNRVPLIVLLGGLSGGATGFMMQWFSAVVHYPIDVGGRPLNSWPAFVPITFELTILFSAFASILGMLILNGLPKPYHPVFNAANFDSASSDRFFLCIESSDPMFETEGVKGFLEGFEPKSLSVVPVESDPGDREAEDS